MVQWYYGKTGSPEGPVDEVVFRDRIAAGVISGETLVWKRGMPEWQKLSSLPEWTELLESKLADPAPVVPADAPPPMPTVPEKRSHIPPPRAKSQNPYASSVSVQRRSIPQQQYYGQSAGTTSGSAIASLVCGILGVTFCALTTIPAIICGHKALAEIRQSGGSIKGQGMAQAGITLGYLGIALIVITLCIVIFSAALH